MMKSYGLVLGVGILVLLVTCEGMAVPVSPKHPLQRFWSCFDRRGMLECVKNEVFRVLDNAIESNVTVKMSPYVSVSKNPDWRPDVALEERNTDPSWLGVFGRLREFVWSRVLQFHLIDSNGQPLVSLIEGRGKKHKQKQGGVFTIGLVAVMAMIAQVVLGKVAVLAAVALIMAKIALIFSTLNGLKKANGSSSGHTSEHVVYEHPGHGGSSGGGGGGWQRSIEPKRTQQQPSYYEDDDLPYRKRRPEYEYRDGLDGA